uniref:Gamma-glutamyltransferase n=1 Tax=Octactis speculum TaxID=3111310 RepID=A0A7S2BWL8_9STRA
MVSLIQSLYNEFGSGLVVPGLGFALQDRGALFALEDGHANIYQPLKRPFQTIMPGFTFNDQGHPWTSFGVMGGFMQPQGQVQILVNMIDFGMGVQEAGDAARYYHYQDNEPTGATMEDGGILELEGGICPSVENELLNRGHTIFRKANKGGYQALERHGKVSDNTIVYHGASEMRKDGQASGY